MIKNFKTTAPGTYVIEDLNFEKFIETFYESDKA